MTVRVLIKFAHGLGDAIQLSVVLKHLRKYRRDWEIHIRCGRGKHSALKGLCEKVWHDQEAEPNPADFNTVLDLGWWENYNRYYDRPNSKITNCLHECFSLPWDAELGRYECAAGPQAKHRTAAYLRSIGAVETGLRFNAVVLHYEGNTSQQKKNLYHWQAEDICKAILRTGRIPVILDWDSRSPLPDDRRIFCPRPAADDIWGGFGSGDAETIAALIGQCEAYIGVDSGPGKIASATDTPTLLCWIEHHPIQFHDPAPNTVHLIPVKHRELPPPRDDQRIGDWFEQHYLFTTYDGEHDLVKRVTAWLWQTTSYNGENKAMNNVQYVLPGGIGDATWALLKIQSIAGDGPLDIILSGDPRKEVDRRCVPYLERFDFVRTARVLDVAVLVDKDNPNDDQGRYRYVEDGQRGDYHYLIPNATLERGQRLETWLPEHTIDWELFKHFSWRDTARGDATAEALDPFVAFYLGPEAGNTVEGHNRNWLWEPKHWIELGAAMCERGLHVAVVGAGYDRSFWERYVKKGVQESGQHWFDLIGEFEIGETLALLRRAKVVVSYQCGLGIVAHYLGTPTVMWWRPDGDTAHPKRKVCFHNAMKDSWVRPGREDRHLGCLYGQETVGDITATIDRRGWLS